MRIVIAEDEFLVRQMLRAICEGELGHEVVGEASSGPATVVEVLEKKPDVLLLDIRMPGCNGFRALEQIREVTRPPRTLIVSAYCDEYTALQARRASVNGFIDKTSCSVETLKNALESLENRGIYFSESFCETHATAVADSDGCHKVLTRREVTILTMVCKLLSDDEIAAALDLAAATVEKHRLHVQRKLRVGNRLELIRYGRSRGFESAR